MIFETHAHYDDEAFDEDREELLRRLPREGIGRVVNIGASLDSCKRTIALMEKYPYIYGAVGVHPSETGNLNEDSLNWLREQCGREKCVAVGEIGLDYHWPEPLPELQKQWFVRQIRLAGEVKLPMVIHSRDAAKDTIEIMQEQKAGEIGGVVHCFSYTKETARVFLDMGFYIGIGGVLTFRNGRRLKEAAQYIPLDRIVLETDSPYLSPEPNRGRRNSSLNLPLVAECLAELKNVSVEEIEQITWENACRLYRMER